MSNLKQLISYYENEGEEELRLQKGGAQYLEFLTAANYLDRFLPPAAKVLDSCAGSGVYSYYLAEQGHLVTAGDIVPHNVKLIREKQKKTPLLSAVYHGDALDLSRFAGASFDAVLLMGALYHFHDPADRRRAVKESLRLLKEDGLFFCTYMNRYAVILNNSAGSLDNIGEILSFAREGKEGIFYASTPEEMKGLMEECRVEKLCHLALDGVSAFLRETAGILDEEGAQRWRDYHLATCEVPSLLGYSYHNMLIGKKAR